MTKKYILVGGYPPERKEQHPGGQVTASKLLVEYAKENHINLKVIDTSQSSFPLPSFSERIKSSIKRIKILKNYLKSEDIAGVIIFSSTGFSFYEKVFMAFITKIYMTKSLLFIRSGHFISLNKKSKLVKLINQFLLKIPSYIGAQGNKWKEFYTDMKVDDSKIKLIYNWIKIYDGIEYKATNDNVTFLFAGWLVEKKGVLELFEVIENNRDLDRYMFKFAGEGTLFKTLTQRIKEKDLKNIELLGWMDREALKEEYKKTDVFVLPSHAEGFPNVILEALNSRLPIISTNVGGIPDSVIHGHNGYLTEPQDIKALYNSIKKLGESESLRKKFSKNSAIILRKNHDFNNTCKKIFEIFE